MSSIAFLGVFFMFFAGKYLRTDRMNTLNSCVVNAQQAYIESLRTDDLSTDEKRDKLRENLRLISNTTSTKLLLADENGKCLVCTEDSCAHEGMFVPESVILTLSSTEKSVSIEDSFANMYDTAYYTVGRAIRNARGDITGFVFSYSDDTRTSDFIKVLVMIFLTCSVIMLMISSIVSVFVTNRMTTTLQSVTNAAKKFTQGDFSARADMGGDDEIAQLAYTFNQMAAFVEKNEKSRSSFVANIAHELRTPMTSIKGFVDGILDGTIPPESETKYLKVVSEEVGRLARLTNSMLDVSKLESGEYQMNARNYNVWDTIATVAFAFESRIERGEIDIKGFEPTKVMVYADKDLVHQIVYNIMDNALKFTPKGGYIGFEIIPDKPSGFVTVKIRNSGKGISAEALPYIFDRFYKEDTSRSVHVKGAGIGLFIVKTLVQRSGGTVTVESQENEYTEFIFTLPSAVSQKTVILPAINSVENSLKSNKKKKSGKKNKKSE